MQLVTTSRVCARIVGVPNITFQRCPRMNEKRLREAAAWWSVENENNPSQQNARMLAIFEWLVDATPQEREEWFETIGGFEAEMAKAVLNGTVDDAPGPAAEVLT